MTKFTRYYRNAWLDALTRKKHAKNHRKFLMQRNISEGGWTVSSSTPNMLWSPPDDKAAAPYAEGPYEA